jgi:signal peptidase I
VGNAQQLTASAGRPWLRTAVYAAGTISMLVLTTAASLAVWVVLPWVFLGWSPTLVTSGSMTPVISPGDEVMLRPAQQDELVPDTVVLYDRPDTGRILHRIVQVLPDGTFRTQGDANASPDSQPVRRSDIRGVAVLAVPWVGRPSLWLHEQRYLLVIATGVVVVALVALSPRAFDPAFDPWAAVGRANPVDVLLQRPDRNTFGGTGNACELLPESMLSVVLERLASQSAAARSRTISLQEGWS